MKNIFNEGLKYLHDYLSRKNGKKAQEKPVFEFPVPQTRADKRRMERSLTNTLSDPVFYYPGTTRKERRDAARRAAKVLAKKKADANA